MHFSTASIRLRFTHYIKQRNDVISFYIIFMARVPNNPLASLKMKEAQMPLTSSCPFCCFSLRDQWKPTSFIVGRLSKWEPNEEIKKSQAEHQENRGPKDITEASWLAVKLSSPPLLCMTSLIQSCLGMHRVCVFHLACQPTAASSPLPFGLVGVNEQQALGNCLRLTRLTKCQRRKRMRRKRAALNRIPSENPHLSVTADESRVWWGRVHFFIPHNVSTLGSIWITLRVERRAGGTRGSVSE